MNERIRKALAPEAREETIEVSVDALEGLEGTVEVLGHVEDVVAGIDGQRAHRRARQATPEELAAVGLRAPARAARR